MLWSFARLKWQNSPLISALAAKSLTMLDEFTSQNISNTAWALEVLSDTSQLSVFIPPAARRFLDLIDLSVQVGMGTEWVDLASIVAAGRGGMFKDRSEFLARFQRDLVFPALDQLAALVDPSRSKEQILQSLQNFMDLHQLPHLGPVYTSHALQALGWFQPTYPAQWVSSSRLAVCAALGARDQYYPVRTERILARVIASLQFHGCELHVPGRLFHAGVPAEADEWTCALLQPAFRHMLRANHAERAALLWVTAAVRNAFSICESQFVEVTGTLQLYASHFPCMSCLSVLGQFARLASHVALEAAFDDAWHRH